VLFNAKQTCSEHFKRFHVAHPPSPAGGVRSIVISVSVCLSVPMHISGTIRPNICACFLWSWSRGSALSNGIVVRHVLPVCEWCHNGPHSASWRACSELDNGPILIDFVHHYCTLKQAAVIRQNKIPHQTICNTFATRGQILKILEAV